MLPPGSSVVLQSGLGSVTATPLGSLLVALVVIALVVFLGRVVLGLAWKLLRIAVVVVALVWVASTILPGLVG